MLVSEFDFDLPEDLIALRPVEPRDRARMLVVNQGKFQDLHVSDLSSLLTPADVLVFNDTKVIPAQLYGRRGAMLVECNLHKRVSATEWRGFAKKTKRMKPGDTIQFGDVGQLTASIVEILDDGEILLRFDVKPGELEGILADIGTMPLPPYIASKRDIDSDDRHDYQTIFARHEGAVAAPTASLHYTDDLLARIDAAGIKRVTLTLHVGAGTFKPVKVEDTRDHKMHAEWGQISPETAQMLNEARRAGGRIVAVGTTAARLLETAAGHDGIIHEFSGDTDIFMTPGYKFKAVDILQTNFHIPKSTLFMLVSAFAGTDVMKAAYAHAIEKAYRFYSYGDSSLLYKG